MQRALGLCVLALFACGPATAGPGNYTVRPGGCNEVVFESSAPMETFRGKSRALSGWIHADPQALGDSVSVHFEVELATLKTGLPKRDKHMRENHLQIDRYPRATFDGVSLNGQKRLVAGKPVALDVEGTFDIHGVRRRLRTTVTTTLQHGKEGEAIQFETSFPVSLAEYGIPRPEFLFMKLSDVQKVTVRGTASTGITLARR